MLAFCRLFEQLDRTSASGLPAWLFDDCHAQVGDSAETVALLWAQVAPSRPRRSAPSGISCSQPKGWW